MELYEFHKILQPAHQIHQLKLIYQANYRICHTVEVCHLPASTKKWDIIQMLREYGVRKGRKYTTQSIQSAYKVELNLENVDQSKEVKQTVNTQIKEFKRAKIWEYQNDDKKSKFLDDCNDKWCTPYTGVLEEQLDRGCYFTDEHNDHFYRGQEQSPPQHGYTL